MKPFISGIRLGLAEANEDFARKGGELRWGEVKGRESRAVRKGDGRLTGACGTERVFRRERGPVGRICGGSITPKLSALLLRKARFGGRGGRGG